MFGNTMAPFIMGNPQAVDQVRFMHEFAREFIGDDMADAIVKVPTPKSELRSQEEENEGLIDGAEIEVDRDDDHRDHLKKLMPLYQRALMDDDMNYDVRRVILQHYMDHMHNLQRQEAQQKSMAQQQSMMPPRAPEAGGQVGLTGSSPVAGGMSDAMSQLATNNRPTRGETPGPQDGRTGRPGRASRPMSQGANQEFANG